MTDNEKLPLKEFMSLPSYSQPNLSYDRKKLAFYWDTTGQNELYFMDLETKEVKKISNGEIPKSPRTGFEWDRTGKKIFFGRDAGGDERSDIWLIDLEGNSKAITETPEANSRHLTLHHELLVCSF